MPTASNTVHNVNAPIAPTSSPSQRTLHLEVGLALACLVLLAIGAWGPSVDQPAHYHAFADQRRLLGIPNLMDVLSNLAFAGFGAAGLWCGWKLRPVGLARVQHNLTRLFFCGLIATAMLSGWYHLQPDNYGLAMDRYGMTIAFAGLLGLAASTRISDRSGQLLALAVLIAGAWSIRIWSETANVLPWATLQFGGMALILCMGCLPTRRGALTISWITVLLIYALAKWLEHGDAMVYHFTNQWISGHTLKHILASCAAVPVLTALADRVSRHPESAIPNSLIVPKG